LKVLDANLLLYAYNGDSPHFLAASSFVNDAFSGSELVGLPWQVIWAFLRLSTTNRVFAKPASMDRAIDIVQQWIDLKHVRLLGPGDRHWRVFRQVLIQGKVRGPLTTDAELAALTIEHGGTLYTTDRDFARFPGLRWVNPLDQS
jgi:toxin-antitoxin system PIN domain toxin